MLIALLVVIAAAVLIGVVVVVQYVRPPKGPAVTRHELTPFEAQSAMEQGSKIGGTFAGGGPGGTWRNKSGTSWKKKTSGE